MSSDIQSFYQEYFQDVVGDANVNGAYLEDAFFEKFGEFLIEEGEIATADRVYYQRRGLRIDGYGGDPREAGGLLTLIICELEHTDILGTLTRTDMETVFKRGKTFLAKALDSKFRAELEETHPSFGLADMIVQRWAEVHKVRFILITNKQMSTRIDGRSAEEFDGKGIEHTVWDIGRIHKILSSKQKREEIIIDFEKDYGGALPVLPATSIDGYYQSYLTVVPGEQLAKIYEKWHTRLLERNVRVFLQAKGDTNKGMRVTLDHNPDMFFAYNNGITAIAEDVHLRQDKEQLKLVSMRNFQIVNGGQTTASIHAASKRKGTNLSNVFVQMKLSIVDAEVASTIVPKISEYANSQNKVNKADFFSNHPFHQRMEEFSRRMFFRSVDGAFRETKWFYERARGQYNDARTNLTPAKKRQFESEYPRSQVFTKTDLAKFLNVWRELPHVVSLGAQKNFSNFGEFIDTEWEKDERQFNEMFFQHLVAKSIIFRQMERLVSDQDWYQGGYRANIVAYVISKVAYDLRLMHCSLDFTQISSKQIISNDFHEALCIVAKAVHNIIVDPPSTTRNVTEWAKKAQCWDRVRALEIGYKDAWLDGLIPLSVVAKREKVEKKRQKELNGMTAMKAVYSAGSEFWKQVLSWGQQQNLLSEKEVGILNIATQISSHKYPSDKQSIILIETLKRLNEEGFPQTIEMPA